MVCCEQVPNAFENGSFEQTGERSLGIWIAVRRCNRNVDGRIGDSCSCNCEGISNIANDLVHCSIHLHLCPGIHRILQNTKQVLTVPNSWKLRKPYIHSFIHYWLLELPRGSKTSWVGHNFYILWNKSNTRFFKVWKLPYLCLGCGMAQLDEPFRPCKIILFGSWTALTLQPRVFWPRGNSSSQ